VLEDGVYFLSDELHAQLWRIAHGSVISQPVTQFSDRGVARIETLNPLVLFSIPFGNGWQLWRSDGTSAGTFALSNFGHTQFPQSYGTFARAGERMVFWFQDDQARWVTRGCAVSALGD